MKTWIFPCNNSRYDVDGAFNKFDELEWSQGRVKVEIGDLVYIYVGKPVQAIRYLCRITETYIPKTETIIDDAEFSLVDTPNVTNSYYYMRIKLLKKIPPERISFRIMQELGVNGSIQGPRTMPANLASYIKSIEEYESDEELVESLRCEPIKEVLTGFEYESGARKKKEAVLVDGRKVYPRNRQTAINALAHAEYKCEINPYHHTFIRKNSDKGYTEPHHLVPMAFSDSFDVSLDVEQNIVSLCSNCHNEIHYGRDARDLIEKLYHKRKEYLESVGISISLEDLLEKYEV